MGKLPICPINCDQSNHQKGATEDEMVGWRHQLNGLEFELTAGASEGQGSLACPWGCKDSDMTEQLSNNKFNQQKYTQKIKKYIHKEEF